MQASFSRNTAEGIVPAVKVLLVNAPHHDGAADKKKWKRLMLLPLSDVPRWYAQPKTARHDRRPSRRGRR